MSELPPKKDHPPGWNDPPMLNYSNSNPPPKSRITNKRLAFPLDGSPSRAPQQSSQIEGPGESAQQPPLPLQEPPLPPSMPIQEPPPFSSLPSQQPPEPPKPTEQPQSSDQSEEEEPMAVPPPPTEKFQPVLFALANENFHRVLVTADNPGLRREISAMMSQWLGGQFPEDIQQTLYDVSDVASRNRVNLFVKLEVNEKVRPFISALKTLYEGRR